MGHAEVGYANSENSCVVDPAARTTLLTTALIVLNAAIFIPFNFEGIAAEESLRFLQGIKVREVHVSGSLRQRASLLSMQR